MGAIEITHHLANSSTVKLGAFVLSGKEDAVW